VWADGRSLCFPSDKGRTSLKHGKKTAHDTHGMHSEKNKRGD